MLAILAVTVAACCWLISAAPGMEEGHQPWRPGSILRVITDLMALDFEYPTSRGTEIKWLIQGLGAAAALLVGAAAWYANTRQASEESGVPDAASLGSALRKSPTLTPAGIAQCALVVFAAWAMLSAWWAPWPEIALGEGLRQLMITIWAIALGRTLSRRSVNLASLALAGILAITAVLGIWYRIERNPFQRLKFPIGNPIFLATCLIPGITLTVAWLFATLPLIFKGSVTQVETDEEPSPVEQESRAFAVTTLTRASACWLAIGSALALIALLWAFEWTDSRGPLIGLIVGGVVAICVWSTGRLRRVLLFAILISLIVAAGYLYLFGWPDLITRRLDTVMFRMYSWSYAFQLFLEQPFAGRGQTSYVLLAQGLSVPQAEYAPYLFPGQLLGHAHNEWLEILADLGAVGFALMAVGLGATCWAAIVAVRRARNGMERATVFGLLAAFVGIVISEATGVALRMPGLPVIFYTVVGLIWAMSPIDRTPKLSVTRYGRWFRLAGLGGAMLACVAMGTLVLRDWKGALAEQWAMATARDYRWEEALRQAKIARQQRLVVEGRLSAENWYNFMTYQAASYRFQQFRDMLARLEQPDRPSAHTLQLAREDSAFISAYAQHCIASGQQLLKRMPDYPYVAGRVAGVLLLTQQMEVAEHQLGLREEVHSYIPAARQWLRAEYERDRLDPVTTLRLSQLSGDRPPAEQIDLLRRPLRCGPWVPPSDSEDELRRKFALDLFGQFEMALSALAQKSGYQQAMAEYVAQARACLSMPDADSWSDPYAPETLRLAARARKLNRQFDEAVQLIADAIQLSEKLLDRFPALVSYALIDQSRYELLAYPNEPERALDACRQAIDRWPATGDETLGAALRRSLVFYLLAAGDEQDACQRLTSLEPRHTEKELDRLIGYGLGELCQKMEAAFGSGRLPEWFDDRLQRCIELAPDWPEGRFLAAYVALERGESKTAIAHIESIVPWVENPSHMARLVITLLNRFPDNTDLQAFARARFGIVPTATPPATTAPAATEPAETMPTTSATSLSLP